MSPTEPPNRPETKLEDALSCSCLIDLYVSSILRVTFIAVYLSHHTSDLTLRPTNPVPPRALGDARLSSTVKYLDYRSLREQ